MTAGTGPPPLTPFDLVLHHDARWSHEGLPIGNRKLREHFDRSVKYLVEEEKYVVTLRHFRGEIIVEEAAFFVRSVDLERGRVGLSDRTEDVLELSSLRSSPIDGALLCDVKRDLCARGLAARFMHGPQAELMNAIEDRDGTLGVVIGGQWQGLPAIE